MARILLVDAESEHREEHERRLAAAGHEVTAVATFTEACTLLSELRFDVVVTGLMLPDGDGMDIVRRAKQRDFSTEVIVLTHVDHVGPAVRAVRAGAADYLVKPVPFEALELVLERTIAMRALVDDNELLRQYIALAEAARRIAIASDVKHALEGAYAAFEALCDAQRSLILLTTSGHFSLQPGHALGQDGDQPLAKHFADVLATTSFGPGLSPLPAPSQPPSAVQAVAVPIVDRDKTWGAVVLLFEKAPTQTQEFAATYLARHLAIGLANASTVATARSLAFRDDLTGLFNARYLQQNLGEALAAASRTHEPLSVLFIDLDHFKEINDTHGHAVGSSLLVELARLVRRAVRDRDAVVRYGGDEFVVILPKADASGAALAAERIRRRISEHRFLAREGYDLLLTASVGVASYPHMTQDRATLLELADQAMYLSKQRSRDRVTIADPSLFAGDRTLPKRQE